MATTAAIPETEAFLTNPAPSHRKSQSVVLIERIIRNPDRPALSAHRSHNPSRSRRRRSPGTTRRVTEGTKANVPQKHSPIFAPVKYACPGEYRGASAGAEIGEARNIYGKSPTLQFPVRRPIHTPERRTALWRSDITSHAESPPKTRTPAPRQSPAIGLLPGCRRHKADAARCCRPLRDPPRPTRFRSAPARARRRRRRR
jgi:hypothetical protein